MSLHLNEVNEVTTAKICEEKVTGWQYGLFFK